MSQGIVKINGLILNAGSMKALRGLPLAFTCSRSESKIWKFGFMLYIIKGSVQKAQSG